MRERRLPVLVALLLPAAGCSGGIASGTGGGTSTASSSGAGGAGGTVASSSGSTGGGGSTTSSSGSAGGGGSATSSSGGTGGTGGGVSNCAGVLGFPGRPAIPIAAGVAGMHSNALADVNGDGEPDLVTVGDGVSVSFGDGHGGFGPMARYALTTSFSTVAVGDLNGDGKPDLVVTGYPGWASPQAFPLGVLLNQGQGTFGPMLSWSIPSGAVPLGAKAAFAAAALGDLNGDGKLDLAVVAVRTVDQSASPIAEPWTQNVSLSVLPGHGDGTFGAAVTQEVTSATGPGSPPASLAAVTAGDLDGDGKLDLVVSFPTNGTVAMPWAI